MPGQCELCNKEIIGCELCSYINNNEIPRFIPIRKRNLVCTKCESEYILKDNNCVYVNNLIPWM